MVLCTFLQNKNGYKKYVDLIHDVIHIHQKKSVDANLVMGLDQKLLTWFGSTTLVLSLGLENFP